MNSLYKPQKTNSKYILLSYSSGGRTTKKQLNDIINTFPEKKVIVVADIGLNESFLIYIDKIEYASIKENPEDYKKYFTQE